MGTLSVIAAELLAAHGIEGEHNIINQASLRTRYNKVIEYTSSEVQSIQFSDPKVQFIYELNGGNKRFVPLINRRYQELKIIENAEKLSVLYLQYLAKRDHHLSEYRQEMLGEEYP